MHYLCVAANDFTLGTPSKEYKNKVFRPHKEFISHHSLNIGIKYRWF